MIRDVSTSTLLTTCSMAEFDNSPWISGFTNRLRYHVSFQVSVCTWLLKARLSQHLVFVECRSSRGGVAVGPPTAFPRTGPVYRGCPAWTHEGVTESRMTLWQRANPCVCAGRSRDVVRTMHSRSTCIKGCVSRSCATENTYAFHRTLIGSKPDAALTHVQSLWYVCQERRTMNSRRCLFQFE